MEKQLEAICNSLEEKFGSKLDTLTVINPSLKNEIFNVIYGLYIGDSENKIADNSEPAEDLDDKIKKIRQKLSFSKNIYWDRNWSFKNSSKNYAHRYGEYLIYKAGEYRLVDPAEFILSDDTSTGSSTFVNLKIKLFESGEGGGSSWFWIKGQNYLSNFLLIKFYLSLDKSKFDEILPFFKDINDELNARQIPFWIKFEKDFTDRYDNAVLYTQQNHYFLVFHIIKKYHNTHQDIFRENNLFFTLPVLKGITFAEETFKRGMSFGQVRAFEILNAFVEYYERKNNKTIKTFIKSIFKYEKNEINVFEFVKKSIENNNYSIEEFYRNPNTHYPYDFSIFKSHYQYQGVTNNTSMNKFWALYIGRLLCKHAIIFRENNKTNCHWISALNDNNEENNIEYHRIDDSFNKGRLGVIYFLTYLYTWFPEDWIIKEICTMVLDSITVDNTNEKIIDEIKILLNNPHKDSNKSGFINFLNNDTTIIRNLGIISDALKINPLRIDEAQIAKLSKIVDEIIHSLKKRGVYSYKEDDSFVATYSDYGYAMIGLALLIIPDKPTSKLLDGN